MSIVFIPASLQLIALIAGVCAIGLTITLTAHGLWRLIRG